MARDLTVKQPYNFYVRYRMFKTGKKLFLVTKDNRKRYMVSPNLEMCFRHYPKRSGQNSQNWAFQSISRLNIFFVDIFNNKGKIEVKDKEAFDKLTQNQRRKYIQKRRKAKYA